MLADAVIIDRFNDDVAMKADSKRSHLSYSINLCWCIHSLAQAHVVGDKACGSERVAGADKEPNPTERFERR